MQEEDAKYWHSERLWFAISITLYTRI